MELMEEVKVIKAEAIDKIQNFIMKRSGLYFKGHDMPSLEENIAKRMNATKCASLGEYYNLLTQSSLSHQEFTELLNLLTNKHTHFFRNPAQFIALKNEILPQIIARKARAGETILNILCAGCATGEEPYSIAMIVLDLLGKYSPLKAWILATDISTEALVFAKKGFYPKRALQHVEKDFIPQYLEKYCLIHQDKIFVSPALKNIVEFQYMNLIDEFYPQGFDIIFCRNVTIYFEIQTTKTVIEKIYQSLNDDGYLFSGGTETLYGISDKFALVDVEGALVYKKIPTLELKPAQEKVVLKSPQTRLEVIEEIPKPQVSIAPAVSLKNSHQIYEQAKGEFIKKDYALAVKLLSCALEIEPGLEEAHILLANILLNQDKFAMAEEECKKAMKINFLSAQAHYLLGLIYKKKGQDKQAQEYLKKAIYLDANYSLAHFTLAETYQEKQNPREALKTYQNTLKALENESEKDFKESSGGLSKRVLAQACVAKMKKLSKRVV